MRILVVEERLHRRFPVERLVRRTRFDVVVAQTTEQAIAGLQREAFDAVVCDFVGDARGESEFVRWLASYSPSTQIVILAGADEAVARANYGQATGITVLPLESAAAAVAQKLEELGPRTGFYGNAVEVELFDYIQMIALTGRDKLVEVQTPEARGLIWFDHGDIVHCQYGSIHGEEGFYRLIAANRGTFRELLNGAPPQRTIARSSTHLLMEAARRFDEGQRGRAAGRGRAADGVDVTEAGDLASPTGDESSFADLNDEVAGSKKAAVELPPRPTSLAPAPDRAATKPQVKSATRPTFAPPPPVPPTGSTNSGEQTRSLSSAGAASGMPRAATGGVVASVPDEVSTSLVTATGHNIFDDPETRRSMLEQFWQFQGVTGVAIISSTGKVLAEDMRDDASLVTLAGFYMRGAGRIARTLGYHVFDGIVARGTAGQQMVMVSMGAASAVLAVSPDADPEEVRAAVMEPA